MNKQKGLAPVLIIILIALAVGGYLLYQKQTKLVVTPQPTPNPVTSTVATGSAEITNWKTYTLSDGTSSFQYPDDWYIENPKDGNGAFINFCQSKLEMSAFN